MAIKQRRSSTYKAGKSSNIEHAQEVQGILKLWVLRVLVPLGGMRDLNSRSILLLTALGLEHLIEDDDFDFNTKKFRSSLKKMFLQTEKSSSAAQPPKNLTRSIDRLAKLVNLSDVECKLLQFAIILHSEQVLNDASDCLGDLSSAQAIRTLSTILDLSEDEIQKAFQRTGMLSRSGLLSLERRGKDELTSKLTLLSSNFAERILMSDEDPIRMLQDIITPCPPPLLSIEDYSHIEDSLRVLIPYLQCTFQNGRQGVNVFLHGPPGTGKTQLSRVLAHELLGELFEVTSQDEDGDPIEGDQRLRAFRAAQCFFAQKSAILMFDEAEDVFNDGGGFFGRKSSAQTKKGWLNTVLEENSVPTIWAANTIDGIDPAFIRRFDMVVELPVPPRIQREKIIRNACGDLLDENGIIRLSSAEHLTPAVVSRATAVTRVIQDVIPGGEVSRILEMLINNSLSAQRLPVVTKDGQESQVANFEPSLINTCEDLIEVTQGLRTTRSGRLCLYGPPGTGKTAFGRWLADRIGVPLHVKRASDLLSKWVGETEKNIARCFARAEKEGALLMLDEVDSFLQDRTGASRSWEVTSVNEVLTQMESFHGVFVASTNLIDNLDQAAFRRFDLKLKFDYLSTAQAWKLFVRKCADFVISEPEEKFQSQFDRLKCLTPGDFAAVARRHRFSRIETARDFMSALEAECSVKSNQSLKKPIGF